jgi:tetratricopeptide (TPR) repeat protein
MEFRLASAAFIVVFATYLFLGGIGVTDRGNPYPKDAAYNRLARGFLSGHLYAEKEVPPGLGNLGDPYDPATNKEFRTNPAYRVQDFSYHNGRLYLYFGAAPALFLFIPWHLLTGAWLPHWVAVVLICTVGLLVNLFLARSIRVAVFPSCPRWMTAVSLLILGLGSYAPLLLARADTWEIPIAFGYLAQSIALRCLWEAFGKPGASAGWIALASAAFGAAFAARPTVLPNAAILLLPFITGGTRRSARAWAAAVVPLGLCGGAVALYNRQRFGNPFDFGQRYQLASEYVARLKLFSPSYLLTNLRLYLFQGVHWASSFPYASEPPDGALPANHGAVEHISGVLLNAPILWAGLGVLVFVRARRPEPRFSLIVCSAAWMALSSLLLMSFFFGTCSRYQFDFAPALALLAAVGVMASESVLLGFRHSLMRWLWGAALAFTAAFTVLYGIDRCVVDHDSYAIVCLSRGDLRDALHEVDIARSLSPGDSLSRLEAGVVLLTGGRVDAAASVFADLVRDHPDDAQAQFNLATALGELGQSPDAIAHFRAASRLAPENAAFRAALDVELAREGPAAH